MHAPSAPRAATRALLPLALLFVGPTADDNPLTFHPEADASATKGFEIRYSVESTDVVIEQNGQEVGRLDQVYRQEVTERVSVLDVWVQTAEGRPTELRRRFSELAVEASEGLEDDDSSETEAESELEDALVVFRWDAEEEEYALELEEGGGSRLLDGLAEDMDLRGFLPEGEGEPDEWDVPVEAWVALVRPGGELGFEYTEEAPLPPVLLGALHEAWEVDLRAESQGQSEVDGESFAVVAVRGEVSAEAEGESEDGENTCSIELEIEVELELLWDPKRGHLRSLEGSGDVTATYRVLYEEQDFELIVTLEGELGIEVLFER